MTHTHAMVSVISKTVATAVLIPILLMATALAPSQTRAQGYLVYVTGIDQPEGCLRIRSAPTTASEIIGCAELGTKLQLTGTWSGNWAQISMPIYGWVYGQQISATGPTYSSSVIIAPSVVYDTYPDYWYSYPYAKRYWRHWPYWWKKRHWKKRHWKNNAWRRHHWSGHHRVKKNAAPFVGTSVRSSHRGSRNFTVNRSFNNNRTSFRNSGRQFRHAGAFTRSHVSRSARSRSFNVGNTGRSFRSGNFGGGSHHGGHGRGRGRR